MANSKTRYFAKIYSARSYLLLVLFYIYIINNILDIICYLIECYIFYFLYYSVLLLFLHHVSCRLPCPKKCRDVVSASTWFTSASASILATAPRDIPYPCLQPLTYPFPYPHPLSKWHPRQRPPSTASAHTMTPAPDAHESPRWSVGVPGFGGSPGESWTTFNK